MGKKLHLKYQKNFENDNNLEENIGSFNFNDSSLIIEIINSGDENQLLKFTQYLSNFNFEESKEDFPFIISKEFLVPFSNLLTTNINFNLKANILSSLINILISFYDCESCQFNLNQFLQNCLLIKIEILLTSLVDSKINNEVHTNFYLSLLDMFKLILDLTNQNEKDNLIINNNLIKSIVSSIIDNQNSNEKLVTNSLDCLFQLVSSYPIKICGENNLEQFLSWSFSVLKEKKCNSVMESIILCSLFYLNSINDLNVYEQNFTQSIIQKIYEEIKKSKEFSVDIEKFQEYIEKYITNTNRDTILMDDEEIENINSIITNDIVILEEKSKYYLYYFKTFSDIIENIPITLPNNNDKSKQEMEIDDEYEEIEDNDEENNNTITNVGDENNSYGTLISNLISKVINEKTIGNFFSNSFFDDYLPLISLNNQIDAYLINDFDKMISLKEYLSQISKFSFSILNNIIFNFYSFSQLTPLHINTIYHSISKILSLKEKICTNDNQEYISIVILLLRNLLEKTQNKLTKEIINKLYSDINYKTLFLIMNKYINENFIKTNIIDIIGLLFSFEHHDQHFFIANKEICNLLNSMFYNEANCEVLAHVINAFMDIYQWDDLEMDKILFNSDVVKLMKKGANEFKSRLKITYNSQEINKDTYQYIKETLFNMKRFITYKEKVFKKLKFE